MTRHYGDQQSSKGKVERFRDCALCWISLHQKNRKGKLARFGASLALAKTFSILGKELQESDLKQISCPLWQIH